MDLAQAGNVYFDAKRPWTDVKSEETRPRMHAHHIGMLFRVFKNACVDAVTDYS